jgi:peptidoglycan hydrolase-like protein with peptidoglycan-binding domain
MTAGLRLANAHPENAALPQLQDAILDPETLAQLFQDIQRSTVVDEVQLKGGPMAMASGQSVPLDEARSALQEGRVLGVQIRYWYNGTHWWDTLMHTPKGIRLIRIEHRV